MTLESHCITSNRKRPRESTATQSTSIETVTMLRRFWKKLKRGSKRDESSMEKSAEAIIDQQEQQHPEKGSDICHHDFDDSSCSSFSSDLGDEEYFDALSIPMEAAPPSTPIIPNLDMLEDLARTHFPDFDVDTIPDAELTDTSDDESTIREKEEKYRTKEDQDVAVFMDLVQRMSIKSLLHLLQGHVRTLNLPLSYMQQYNAALSTKVETNSGENQSVSSTETEARKKTRQKQFRWAEVTNQQVRVVVHEIDSFKAYKDELWWKPEEIQAIRADLLETVQFFRKHRPNYIQSIETIARATESQSVIEDHMKCVTNDSYARGLEAHIVRMLSDHRKSTVRAVIEEQNECRMCDDDAETTRHCLREQSVAYSQLSTKFALNMAKCDQIDACKATMARWRVAAPAIGFFTAS